MAVQQIDQGAPSGPDDMRKRFPKPPAPAQVRQMFPAFADKTDGEIADALWDRVYKDKYEQDWSGFKKFVLGKGARVHFDADMGYDPYGITAHNLGELVSGASAGLVGPPAKTEAEKETQGAGATMRNVGLLQASKLIPPVVRGAPNPPTGEITPRWTPPPQQLRGPAIPALTNLSSNPWVRRAIAALGAAGAGGLGAGAGYNAIRRWFP